MSKAWRVRNEPKTFVPTDFADNRTSSWDKAIASTNWSDAACLAQLDLRRAAHRPSGKIAPRKRWSFDEPTLTDLMEME